MSFSEGSLGCFGGKKYFGFSQRIMPNFEYFLSCGIPGELEGERYKKSPEIVKAAMKRMPVFEALQLLHSLAMGMEQIHLLGEYHADIHSENIMVKRRGLGFEVSLIDFFDLGRATRERIQNDVYQMIHLFYHLLGGAAMYWKIPQSARGLIRGRRYDLIAQRYRNAGQLRIAMENLEW